MLRIDEVQDSPGFPEAADVVVVGGGIIGICTAYELARRGVSVALLEKGFVAAEQSGRNWGWVRQQHRDYHELPIAMHALRRWGELEAEIGRDLGFRRNGVLFATEQPAELEKWQRWNQGAAAHGFCSEVLSAAQVRARVPNTAATWVGGIWSPTDGRAEPTKAAPAIAEGAKNAGVHLHQTCAVRGLDIAGGKVAGVWTERGLIRTSTVVAAGGAWNARLCRQHGVDLPIANIVGTAMRTSVAPEVVSGCFSGPGFALRRRLDGGYTVAVPGYGRVELAPHSVRNALKFYPMFRSNVSKKLKVGLSRYSIDGPDAAGGWTMDEISPFERMRITEPAIDAEWLPQAMAHLTRTFPELQGIRVVQAWAGLIDTTPDLVPFIGAAPQLPGLVVASGFSGHGFALGPGAGKLVSQIVMNETPFCDIGAFGLSRFGKGAQIRRPELM